MIARPYLGSVLGPLPASLFGACLVFLGAAPASAQEPPATRESLAATPISSFWKVWRRMLRSVSFCVDRLSLR